MLGVAASAQDAAQVVVLDGIDIRIAELPQSAPPLTSTPVEQLHVDPAQSAFVILGDTAGPVPSCPALSITTFTASALSVVVPRIPAMNVLVWSLSPMRIVLLSAATPEFPIAILLSPVRLDPAKYPNAMFPFPIVLKRHVNMLLF